MNKILEFWQGNSGRLSSTRLLTTTTAWTIMTVWAIVSLRKNDVLPLPEELVWLILGCLFGQQAPKFMQLKTGPMPKDSTTSPVTS